MDLLAARIAARRAHAQARAARLRPALPELVAELRARGASRIVLIGSLARGDEPHEDTDLDLVVWGLDATAAYEAGGDLGARVVARVDVIPADIAGPRLLRAVAAEGVELFPAEAHVTG